MCCGDFVTKSKQHGKEGEFRCILSLSCIVNLPHVGLLQLNKMRLITILLVTALLLVACDEQGGEAQIAQNLSAIEEAVEAKDFPAIAKYLHTGFVANDRMGIEEVRQLLRLYSLRHKKLTVTIVGRSTTMHANFSDRATSTVSVVVTGSSGLLPSDGSLRTVEVEWVEDGGDWLIRKARWQR